MGVCSCKRQVHRVDRRLHGGMDAQRTVCRTLCHQPQGLNQAKPRVGNGGLVPAEEGDRGAAQTGRETG